MEIVAATAETIQPQDGEPSEAPAVATDVNVEVEMETVEVDEGEGIGEADTTLRPAAQRVPRQKKRKGLRLSLILNAITFGHTFPRHLTPCKGTNDAGLGGWAMFRGWEIHVRSMSVEFMAGLAAGAWTGLTLMRRYKKTKKEKDRTRQILDFEYGSRELKVLMGAVPYWIDFGRSEQVSSINNLIQQVWKFYDAAICKKIAETVEPIMMQYKPVFVSAIKFKKLTFGMAPFTITHVAVIKEDIGEIVLEMGIRWHGDAHLAIGVEVVGAGLITPAVKRLSFFANVRIALARMVPKMPAVGALLLSFQSPPFVTFDLDCGPGIGELIESWLIPFLKNDLLGNMLVWPNRIIVPLLPPDVTGPLDNLELHTKGVLKVTVVEARGLPKADIIGKGDPFAVLETVALKPIKTKIIHNTDCPKWNETLFLKVQEIEQLLRVTVRDQESTLVGALTMTTSELQGRCFVSLQNLTMGEMRDEWHPLGNRDWGDLDGPGQGCGEIRLQLTYYSLEAMRAGNTKESTTDSTPRGLVFLTVLKGNNLHSVDNVGISDPYCVLWLDHIKKTTKALKNTRDPVWNESVDWFNVSALEDLFVEVYDKGKLSDRLLGKGKLPLLPIAKEFGYCAQPSPVQCVLELEGNRGDVSLLIEWVPLDRNPLPVHRSATRKFRSLVDTSLQGVLFVRLISAEDLRNVDTMSLSDPFVILKIGGSPKVSKFIRDNLNPVWKESFAWSRVRDSAVLHGEVKDKGVVADTSLGVFKLPIAALLDPPGEVHPFTLPLTNKRTNAPAQGRVNLQMCWKLVEQRSEEESPPEPEEPQWPDFQCVASAEPSPNANET